MDWKVFRLSFFFQLIVWFHLSYVPIDRRWIACNWCNGTATFWILTVKTWATKIEIHDESLKLGSYRAHGKMFLTRSCTQVQNLRTDRKWCRDWKTNCLIFTFPVPLQKTVYQHKMHQKFEASQFGLLQDSVPWFCGLFYWLATIQKFHPMEWTATTILNLGGKTNGRLENRSDIVGTIFSS